MIENGGGGGATLKRCHVDRQTDFGHYINMYGVRISLEIKIFEYVIKKIGYKYKGEYCSSLMISFLSLLFFCYL